MKCIKPITTCRTCPNNDDCSHSEIREEFPLADLISSVIITEECSSYMLTTIDRKNLKPNKFKINNKWKNLN